eukprot:scaffold1589_cov111-Isochrysis_galbana.AAC.13
MVHGSRQVIDLCDGSPDENRLGGRAGTIHGNGGRQPKRRRDGSRAVPTHVPMIQLSDDEDDTELARRLADAEERIHARERIREDERLARQLQEEEHGSQAIFRSPSGHSPGSSRMPYAYGGSWGPGQLFGGLGRDPMGDDLLHGGAFGAGFGGHGGIGALGAAGLSALFGDGYHVAADGGGGLYAGGGRGGSGHGGSVVAGFGIPPWARAAADAGAHAAAMRRVLGGSGGGGRGRAGQHLAHLSFLDRDFGEADYEMLLALDDDLGPEKKRALKANAKRVEQLPSHRLSKQQVCPRIVS